MTRRGGSTLERDPYEEAEENGQEVVEPYDNQLQIDIDSEEDLGVFHDMVRVLRDFEHVAVAVYPSHTPHHYHAYATISRNVDAVTRIAFQACLGSDRKRELFSLLRVVQELDVPPTLFFEKKGWAAEQTQRAIRVREEEGETA